MSKSLHLTKCRGVQWDWGTVCPPKKIYIYVGGKKDGKFINKGLYWICNGTLWCIYHLPSFIFSILYLADWNCCARRRKKNTTESRTRTTCSRWFKVLWMLTTFVVMFIRKRYALGCVMRCNVHPLAERVSHVVSIITSEQESHLPVHESNTPESWCVFLP